MAVLDSTENTFPPLFDVGAVWARLWKRRLTILASVSLTVALALVYLAVTKPTYTATASLLIDPRDARSTQFQTVLPGIGADSAAVASQVFVIESRDLLTDVFEAEDIARDPEFSKPGLLAFLTPGRGSGTDAIFRRFERRVSVERAGLTYVIEVSFKSESAEKAARIANAIVERYRAGLAGERENANSDVNTRLSGRIAALQRNVSAADREVGDFKVAHDLLDPAAGGTLQSQIDQLTTQLIDARANADQAKSRYDQAVSAGTSPAGLARLAEIVSSAALDGLRGDYNQRAAAFANAEAIYQARHPTIRRLRSELQRTNALMAAEAERVTRELKAKHDLSRQAVATLEAKLAALREKSQAADAARVELRRLEAKAAAARTVLDDVMKRVEETAQMRGLQLSEARVIGLAAPPVQPTWPTPLLLLPVSAAIGLLAGCGLAVAGVPGGSAAKETAFSPMAEKKGAMRRLETPVNLGHYLLPGLSGAGAPARIRAMRRCLLQHGGEAFSQETFRLVRRVVARLTEHPAPYRLLVSSVDSPTEARLAAAMIGLGLQQAGQSVLSVEFSAQPHEAGVFANGASGLPTIVRPLAAAKGLGPAVPDAALAGGFDFVLLLAPPLAGPEWNAGFSSAADLMLFALAPADNREEADETLRQRLADGLARSATLVVGAEEADTLARSTGAAR